MADKIVPTMKALSIRQPWCHHILYDGKDVENRTWPTKFRGWVLIHASKGYDAVDREDIRENGMPLGGICGVMRIVDCVSDMQSRWFNGPYGFVIRDAQPVKFIPCRGALGFFTPDIDFSQLERIGEHQPQEPTND